MGKRMDSMVNLSLDSGTSGGHRDHYVGADARSKLSDYKSSRQGTSKEKSTSPDTHGDVQQGAEHQVPVDSSRNLQRGDEQALQEGATPDLRKCAAPALRVYPPRSVRDHPGREVLEGAFR